MSLHLFKRKKKAGVFAVIFNEKKEVLLIHRTDHNVWEIPGGGLEQCETPWDAVVREVKEETGLTCRVIKLVGVYARPSFDELIFSFLCEVVGGVMHTTTEADCIEYFSISQLPDNIPPQKVQRIYDACKETDTTFLRTLDDLSTREWIQKKGL